MDARLVGLILLSGGGGIALFMFSTFPAPGPDVSGKTTSDAYFELFKFAVTAMIAGGVAMIWAELKRREEAAAEARAAREASEAARRKTQAMENAKRQKEIEEYFRDLALTYNDIKRERRVLNHALLPQPNGTYEIFDDTYNACMDTLNRLQLQVEFGKRLAELGPGALAGIGPAIKGNLDKAENYLRDITREYESRTLPYRLDPKGGGWVEVTPESHTAGFLSSRVMQGRVGPKASSEFFGPMDDVYGKIGEEVKRLGGSTKLPRS